MKKLIPALCMFLVAASLLATSTYAWFSMNTKVTVTGMEVKTKVGDNLFITNDTLTSNSTITADASYKLNEVKTVSGLLEPVSSIDGKNFWYTLPSNVNASGDANNEAYTQYTDDTSFATANGITSSIAYVDYVFQMKAVNTSTTGAATLVLNELKLTYGGTADTSKAWRVALFVEPLDTVVNSTKVATTKAPAGALTAITPLIFTPASAANFTDGEAVNSATGTAAVTYVSDTTSAKWTVATDTTAYFKVVARLWLEGEDKTCNNDTFVQLTDEWALDLAFTLDGYGASPATTPVQNIAMSVTAAKKELSSATKGSNTVVVDGKTYTELSVTGFYITDSTFSNASHVYQIVSGHVIDITNQCTLPAAT